MNNNSKYQVEFYACLPFRPKILPFEWDYTFQSDQWQTSYSLTMPDTFSLHFPGLKPPKLEVNTQSNAIITIKTSIAYRGSLNELLAWASADKYKTIQENLHRKLNDFLDRIKYWHYDTFRTSNVRNVGLLDLVFYTIQLEDKSSFVRFSPSFPIEKEIDLQKQLDESVNDRMTANVPTEWRTLVRAVDLVNHGFPTEGFIVAFALLDQLTQDFVKQKMSHLTPTEKSTLLRQIESRRLSTYLGPLLKTLTGETPLEKHETRQTLKWLNSLRNEALHDGNECTIEDSKRAIQFIHELLIYYKSKDAKLVLPDKLLFWA